MRCIAAGLLAASLSIFALAPEAFAQSRVGYIEIEGEVADRSDDMPLFLAAEADPALVDYSSAFRRIANGESNVDAVVLRLRDAALTLAQVQELGDAIEAASDAGTPVHVFTENYSPTHVLLGAYADEALVQKGGSVTFAGVYAEELRPANFLRWMGVHPQFIQIGKYKGTGEILSEAEPSPAYTENRERLLTSVYSQLRETVKEGRGLDDAQLDDAMSEAFLLNADRAVELGIVTKEIDRLGLEDYLASTYGDDFVYAKDLVTTPGSGMPDLESAGLFEVFAAMQAMFSGKTERKTTGPTIAVLHIDGAIMDGKSSSGGFAGSPTVGALTIRETLAKLADDPNIKGIVVRINSPGGSATASDSIYIGLRQIADEGTPVWTSVADVAASGGYYIACGADKIYVNPSSIIGSIGVVAGKLSLEGVMEKLQINVVTRSRGPRAHMLSATQDWSSDDLAFLRDQMDDIYDIFTERVADSREGIDLGNTAEGRIFTGEDGVELRLADGIATLDQTIDRMASEIGLASGYDVFHYPEPPSFDEIIEETFGAAATASHRSIPAMIRSAASLVVPRSHLRQLFTHIDAVGSLQEHHIGLVMPSFIIFR